MVTHAYDATYFSRLYGTTGRPDRAARFRDRVIADLVTRFAPLRPGARLCDVGCGFGYLLSPFAADYEVCGCDISEHAIARARRLLPGARFCQSDLEQGLGFPGPFAAVLAINILEHLHDPGAALVRIREALEPEGVLVAHLPTISNRFGAWVYTISYRRDPTHIYKPSAKEFIALTRACGFEPLWQAHAPYRTGALMNWVGLPGLLAAFRKEKAEAGRASRGPESAGKKSRRAHGPAARGLTGPGYLPAGHSSPQPGSPARAFIGMPAGAAAPIAAQP